MIMKKIDRNDIEDQLKKVTNCNDEPRKDSEKIYYSAYKNAEKALEKLIKKFPGNKSLDEIYLKVTAINSLYSTNIYDTYKMAYHIFKRVNEKKEEDIDARLEKTDLDHELIHDIATGHKIKRSEGGKTMIFYSFATKYCSFHKPEKYAIYDTLIQSRLIKHYNENIAKPKKEKKVRYEDLREYKRFMEVINEVKKHYRLDDISLKEFDMYLWLTAKEESSSEVS